MGQWAFQAVADRRPHELHDIPSVTGNADYVELLGLRPFSRPFADSLEQVTGDEAPRADILEFGFCLLA